MGTLSLTKEARKYNGEKIVSSISGAGKTGHVHVKKNGIWTLSNTMCMCAFSVASVVSDSLWPHESQHARPPCSSPSPRVHSDSRPLKHKRRWIVKAILRKKNETGGNQPYWLKTILQSYSHQDSMVLGQNRNIDKWNKIESPEINPCTYGHLNFDKGGKNI